MNHTTSPGCGFLQASLYPSGISSDIQAVFIARIALNAFTCPLIVLLNILVMVAVTTKRQLRTQSNIALACLATTDLAVALVVQPLCVASDIFFLRHNEDVFCTLTEFYRLFAAKCFVASFYHLLLTSAERYLAIKHPFTYETHVTGVRVIIASGLVWATMILSPMENILLANSLLVKLFAIISIFFFLVMVYFNVSVYIEVRHSKRQIAANQVSLDAKGKILKNKKTFYTTVILLLAIFLCYIPVNVLILIFVGFTDTIRASVGENVFRLVVLLPVVNSLFNPLIYVVRIRYFRVAFIEILTRKTTAQAEEVERKIFGPRQIAVIASAEHQQEMANGDNEGHEGEETLNHGHETVETTVRTQPLQEEEETAF